jgi:hydroxymethylpyrimidine pyrophosphatase-like HAD family hydrolase
LDYDLIAIDLDGTLLNSQHALPAENAAAVGRACAAGLRIVLCTGRAYAETRPIVDALGFELDAVITVSGALVCDARSGATLHRAAIPHAAARAAAAWFGERGYPVFWLNDPNECGADGWLISGPRRHPAVDRWMTTSPCRVTETAALPADCAAPLRLSVIDDAATLTGVQHDFDAAFDGAFAQHMLKAPQYDLALIETYAPHVNKWYGIEQLCRRWDIPPARTVAIGDDVNDVEMLERAGLSIAMANAHPPALAAAQRVTVSNDACGVARVIDELLTPQESKHGAIRPV